MFNNYCQQNAHFLFFSTSLTWFYFWISVYFRLKMNSFWVCLWENFSIKALRTFRTADAKNIHVILLLLGSAGVPLRCAVSEGFSTTATKNFSLKKKTNLCHGGKVWWWHSHREMSSIGTFNEKYQYVQQLGPAQLRWHVPPPLPTTTDKAKMALCLNPPCQHLPYPPPTLTPLLS